MYEAGNAEDGEHTPKHGIKEEQDVRMKRGARPIRIEQGELEYNECDEKTRVRVNDSSE